MNTDPCNFIKIFLLGGFFLVSCSNEQPEVVDIPVSTKNEIVVDDGIIQSTFWEITTSDNVLYLPKNLIVRSDLDSGFFRLFYPIEDEEENISEKNEKMKYLKGFIDIRINTKRDSINAGKSYADLLIELETNYGKPVQIENQPGIFEFPTKEKGPFKRFLVTPDVSPNSPTQPVFVNCSLNLYCSSTIVNNGGTVDVLFSTDYIPKLSEVYSIVYDAIYTWDKMPNKYSQQDAANDAAPLL